MAQSTESDKEELVDSIRTFLTAMSMRGEQQRFCILCGAVMQSLDMTMWLHGSDSEWSIRLPVCPCEATRTPVHSASQRKSAT